MSSRIIMDIVDEVVENTELDRSPIELKQGDLGLFNCEFTVFG